MVSSAEEFLLLLKKWMSESTPVAVFAALNGFGSSDTASIQVRGTIIEIEENEGRFTVAGEDHSFAAIPYARCRFAYEADSSVARGALNMTALTGEKYNEVAIIVSPTSPVVIAIFSVSPAEDT